MSISRKTDEEQEFVMWLASQRLHGQEDLVVEENKRVLCSLFFVIVLLQY